MLTLNELLKTVNQHHGNKEVTLSLALHTWAHDENISSELSAYLEPCGLPLSKARQYLDSVITRPIPLDGMLIERALHSGFRDKVYATSLLITMCGSPHYQLTREWIQQGLDVAALKEILEQQVPEPSILEKMACQQNGTNRKLSMYGEHLTDSARRGHFLGLYPRKQELDQLMMVLLKTQKGHAILTGPAGVGKSCLVEQLANAIVEQQVPTPLLGSEIYQISMSKIVAGTIYRGQFEERLEQIMSEIAKDHSVILFIDEFHLVWGAGRTSESSMDAANILKPYLARNDFHLIGATTNQEYHRFIAQDQALARRFDEIPLTAPTGDLLFQMVTTASTKIVSQSGLRIDQELIKNAIQLSDQYLPNRSQPDKAIDLIDLAASKALMENDPLVTRDSLLSVLSMRTGVTFAKSGSNQTIYFSALETKLKDAIIGQEDAIEQVVNTLTYRRSLPYAQTDRNLGTFFFSGPSGVGKTELGRVLAYEMFGGTKALLHIDLAEYSHGADISRLIGSAPGLVGYDNPGVLTAYLHEQACGVILFDEVEKAAKEVQDFLLGILDNGRVRSGKGELLSTREHVIIVTTNALKQNDLQKTGVGFIPAKEKRPALNLLSQYFSREFLNRFDELILFRSLSENDLRKIIQKEIKFMRNQLGDHQNQVTIDENELTELILRNLDQEGARSVHRALEKCFLQPLLTGQWMCWRISEKPLAGS